jgi:hypothetical protein
MYLNWIVIASILLGSLALPPVSSSIQQTQNTGHGEIVNQTGMKVVRIMHLGDSITHGGCRDDNNPQCDLPVVTYRYHVWNQLMTSGYVNVDFIGSMYTAIDNGGVYRYPDFDQDHEGHTGYKVYDMGLDAEIKTYINTYYPDIVLSYLANNDLAYTKDPLPPGFDQPAEAIKNYKLLIGRARAVKKKITFFIATLLPCQTESDYCNPGNVNKFNALLPAMAKEVSTTDSPVYIVDMNTGMTQQDLADKYPHPSTFGDFKMGQRWLEALKTVLIKPTGQVIDDATEVTVDGNPIQYNGEWTRVADCELPPDSLKPHYLLNDTCTKSNQTGATASWSFNIPITGSVAFYGVKRPENGIVGVSIDGGAEQMVDLYSVSDFSYAYAWISNPLTSGTHTINVRVTGRKNAEASGATISIDRFETILQTYALYEPTPTPTSVPTNTSTPIPNQSTPTPSATLNPNYTRHIYLPLTRR